MQSVIGIVGMPGVGKTTALKVARTYGTIISMGDVIRDEAKSLGLENNSENLGRISKILREKNGPDVIAQRCIDKLKKNNQSQCFIDGIRSNHEVELFKNHFNIKIIAIVASDELRHQWILGRKREDDTTSIDKIIQRDDREISFGIKEVIENAEYKIQNNGTVEDLEKKCSDIIGSEIGLD